MPIKVIILGNSNVTDPNRKVVQLTDKSGAVTKTYEYDSFGNEIKPDGKDENPFRYCGEHYDKETEEIYLRARYYQPVVGRFLTRDMYTGKNDDPLSLHLYAYCGNDGVNAWDPGKHKANKLYKKLNKAVKEFAAEAIKKTIKNTWEYGTFFYKKNKKYAYYKPWTDKHEDRIAVTKVVEAFKKNIKWLLLDIRILMMKGTVGRLFRYKIWIMLINEN